MGYEENSLKQLRSRVAAWENPPHDQEFFIARNNNIVLKRIKIENCGHFTFNIWIQNKQILLQFIAIQQHEDLAGKEKMKLYKK